MTLSDNTERLVQQMHLRTRALTDERILKDAFAQFEKSAPYTKTRTIKNNVYTRLVTIAAAVAIVVFIWSVSHFLIKSNQGLAVTKQVYNTLDKSENYCISNYLAGQEEPFQQMWVLKSVDMKMLKNVEKNSELLTLWDLSKNIKMISQGSLSSLQTESITDDMLHELDKTMLQVFSLDKFGKLSEIPKNAAYHWIHDAKVDTQFPDSDVFELSWQQEDSDGKLQYFKWRIFVKEKTFLPKRAELYIKSNSQDEYALVSISIVSYPGEENIKNIIRKNFGPVLSSPQYQPTGGQ
jgi:hypothetical protein